MIAALPFKEEAPLWFHILPAQDIYFFSGEGGITSGDPQVGRSAEEARISAALRAPTVPFLPALASRLASRQNEKCSPVGAHHFFWRGGIRTRDSVSTIHTFQACSFNHSDTSPFSKDRKNKVSTQLSNIFICRISPLHVENSR